MDVEVEDAKKQLYLFDIKMYCVFFLQYHMTIGLVHGLFSDCYNNNKLKMNQLMVKSRMPGSKYFFYRGSSFHISICEKIYVGCDSTFEGSFFYYFSFHIFIIQLKKRLKCFFFSFD